MSYIEKEKLIKADIGSIENRVRHAFNQGYGLGFKDGKEKAKSHEQKPMLDKIRAEIERLQKMCDKNDLNLLAQYSAFGMVLDILDKYKAESEVDDGNDD